MGWEREFPRLRELGITALEVMPVNGLGGSFGWGYDGVNLFAPYHMYGTSDDLRHMVNAAHTEGLAVVLDVVYNHLGSDGNYLAELSKFFFSKTLQNGVKHPILTEITANMSANLSFRTQSIGSVIFISTNYALMQPKVASIPAYMANRFSLLWLGGRERISRRRGALRRLFHSPFLFCRSC
jgi:hypothetical protein